MKKAFSILMVLAIQAIVLGTAVPSSQKPACCKTNHCQAGLTCCTPEGQRTTPPVLTTVSPETGKLFAAEITPSVLISADRHSPLPRGETLPARGRSPPLFILNSSLLI